MKQKILWIEDDPDFRELVEMWLEAFGLRVQTEASAEAALPHLADDDLDLVLADLNLSGMSGLDLCAEVAKARPGLPVIVLTAFGSLEAAIGAIRAGAYDFLTKPCEKEHLQVVLERALAHRRLQRKVRNLEAELERSARVGDIIGESAAVKRMTDLLVRVADTETTVLVQGESGTGKELVARALHQRSRRADGPFIAVNCAAMPATLLESELFGHVKGSFTDAKEDKVGLLSRADGGTLFLDEIGEMPMEMQVKLLRVLQEKKVRPVGGHEELPYDARLVCATNRDLQSEVDRGTFREDLYYRVNVVCIAAPPLRARGNDVLLLAQAFVETAAARNRKRVAGLSEETARRLLEYEWPGNVRELENCIESAVALTRNERVEVEDLPERVRSFKPKTFAVPTSNPDELLTLQEVEDRYIAKVVDAVNGNKSAAARVLAVDRRTLYRKLDALEKKRAEPEAAK